VTSIINKLAVGPLAPVDGVLAAIRLRHGEDSLQGLAPGLVVPSSSALGFAGQSAAQLLTDEGVARLLATAAVRWNAQPPAAAALAWKCYSYWLALPAVLGFATARRVPLMSPDRVLVRASAAKPFLTLALHEPRTAVLAGDPIAATDAPGLVVVPDEAALLDILRTSLVEEHLEPLLDRVREHVHIGRRTLVGSVASGIAHGLSRAADALPGSTLATANTILAALDADDLVELTVRPEGGLRVQRRTCCLAFTLPKPKVCSGCCIRGE
jgi:hypothetical protein